MMSTIKYFMSVSLSKNRRSSSKNQLALPKQKKITQKTTHYFSRLTDFLPDIIYIYDLPREKTVFVNKSFTTILGYAQRCLLNDNITWSSIIHPVDQESAPAIGKRIMKLQDGATMEYEIQCKTAKGVYIWLHNKLTVFLRDKNGMPEQVLVTSHDITYRKTLESRLLSLAYTDGLTGLCNRTVFIEELEYRLQSKNHDFAVLFLDLDDFKDINDTFGHSVGDSAIRETARRLSNLLPHPNIVARLGGDEFTMIIDGCKNIKAVTTWIKKITNQFVDHIVAETHTFPLGASIGSVLANQVKSPTVSKLLKLADQAMYESKNARKMV